MAEGTITRITGGTFATELSGGMELFTDTFDMIAGKQNCLGGEKGTIKDKPEKPKLTDNDFIPIISIDKSFQSNCKYIGNVDKKTTELSEYLDNKKQSLEVVKITIPAVIRLKMEKGSSKANDKEGNIRIITDGVLLTSNTNKTINHYENKKSKRILSKTEYTDMEYDVNKLFRIKVTPSEIQKDAYIDFFADDDDLFYSSVSNVHCGRIAIVNTSKVGKRLIENIEALPIANESQRLPSGYEYTYGHPEASFDIANKYQNCLGMCFAITMARVKKAFQDQLSIDLITLDRKHQDYITSGTISLNIPEKYFGYGVGGLLASKGYADLITNKEVWEGKLEEGAILQYWTNKQHVSWNILKEGVKDSIRKIQNVNFGYGHSVIFKSYLFDEKDVIYGIRYYDYHGTDEGQTFLLTDENGLDGNVPKLFFGANLKDKK